MKFNTDAMKNFAVKAMDMGLETLGRATEIGGDMVIASAKGISAGIKVAAPVVKEVYADTMVTRTKMHSAVQGAKSNALKF